MPSSDTVFGFHPIFSITREKKAAQAVVRDFNGRRVEESLLMRGCKQPGR
jgi:hypothetical protein